MLSITSVELLAIAKAITLVPTGVTLHVITDSKGALSILNRQGGSSGASRDILENASRKFRAVRFTWVPSHCGIPGNEKADQLASEAITKPYILLFKVPPRELARTVWPITGNPTWPQAPQADCYTWSNRSRDREVTT